MNPQRWDRIGEIYHSALPLDQTERAAFVTNACSGDSTLRHEVELLLKADESSGGFLQTDIFTVGLKILMDNSKSDGNPRPATAPDKAAHETLAGTVLDGRYRIDRELGQGGVGVVYLAHDQKLHQKPVVVKVLLEKTQTHKWLAQKFLQEKEALARVDHPGVVGLLDAGELPDGQPYIVMQFVDGISLRKAIKSEAEGLDLPRVASILKQAGSALSAVHEKKIYHRDLKPENIMLQRLVRGEEQVKILDFGVAKVKESLIAPSTVTGAMSAGTIVYMSPEQLRGDKVTATSDIYSLGLIAYEMITGRRPFKPDTVAQLSDMQRAGVRVNPIDLRPRLPEAAQSVILRALAFDPAARYQSAAEFGDELARTLLDEEEAPTHDPVKTQSTLVSTEVELSDKIKTLPTPFEPLRPTPDPTIDPESRSRRWPLALGVLAIVAALSFGAYLLIANRESLFGGNKSARNPTARSLAYSLTVQKMRDNKPYEEPFQSSGQEIFESGYKFRLNVSSPQSGYLYVFNEGADQNGAMSFTIIYPTPVTNNGSAKIDANRSIQTNWNTFEGKPGTEQFWMIWSESTASVLEAARDAAFKGNGRVTDAAMIRNVREFLTKHSDPRSETTKDTARRETQVRGNGDVLVKLVELEHR
jgi:serine/threonine protein kinase